MLLTAVAHVDEMLESDALRLQLPVSAEIVDRIGFKVGEHGPHKVDGHLFGGAQ